MSILKYYDGSDWVPVGEPNPLYAKAVINDMVYPVGSVYVNATNSDNPATLLGVGTWVAFGAGRVPIGIDSGDTDFDTAEEASGSKTHSLVNSNLPRYNGAIAIHGAGSNTVLASASGSGITAGIGRGTYRSGGSGISGSTSKDGFSLNIGQSTPAAISNVQPYIVVYMWKRTA